jgi:hypothetical protein
MSCTIESKLFNTWRAVESSLKVRASLLADLAVTFEDNNEYTMRDTSNRGYGEFTVSFDDNSNLSGILSINPGIWTCRDRIFETKEETDEAYAINSLVGKLYKGQHKFSIGSNGRLNIYYDDNSYVSFKLALFDINNLYKKWQASESELQVRSSLLKDVILTIFSNDNFWITDTANSSNGTYNIKIKEDLSNSSEIIGKITFKANGWTQQGRLFNNGYKQDESNALNRLAHRLSDGKHTFVLSEDKLVITVNEKNYVYNQLTDISFVPFIKK